MYALVPSATSVTDELPATSMLKPSVLAPDPADSFEAASPAPAAPPVAAPPTALALLAKLETDGSDIAAATDTAVMRPEVVALTLRLSVLMEPLPPLSPAKGSFAEKAPAVMSA